MRVGCVQRSLEQFAVRQIPLVNRVWFHSMVVRQHTVHFFPRSFNLDKWISCATVWLFWAWRCWPPYCCTCCCRPSARAAWNHPLKFSDWDWCPHPHLHPLTCLFAPVSYQGTLRCSSGKLYPLTELGDRYCPGKMQRPNKTNRTCLISFHSLSMHLTNRLQVVLLHGQAFTSKTWEELGTMALLAANGYQALAMDLPGRADSKDFELKTRIIIENILHETSSRNLENMQHVKHISLVLQGYGKSPDSEALKTDQNRVDLLSRFMESLGVRAPVLLSPSMSGHYSIPFLMKNSAQLHGFVPVAPVGTRNYTPQQYQSIQVSGGLLSFLL